MKRILKLVVVAFFFSAAALAQTPTPGKALVYVYKPGRRKTPVATDKGELAEIYAGDKKLVAQLREGQWTAFEVDPGELKLQEAFHFTMTVWGPGASSESGEQLAWGRPLQLQVVPGKAYYVEAGDFWQNRMRLRKEAEGRKGIERCEEVKANALATVPNNDSTGIGDASAVGPLDAALKDTDSDVRKRAAEALGNINGPGAAEAPSATLKDTTSSVRQAAAGPVAQESKTVSASAAAPTAQASIYVYRQGHMLGAIGHPIIFVNDYLLAEMHNSNYASLEVPQGTVIVSATFANQGDLLMPSPTGYWASLPGCTGLDARRFFAAPLRDVGLCSIGLTELYKKCQVYTTTTGSYTGVRITTTHIPYCAPKLNGSGDALYLLNLVLTPRLLHQRLQIEVETGKTYYVKWSVSGSGGKMELVDAKKGAKEIKGLHLAKDR